ncbi:coatomer subunit beta [Trichinella spiralis]|uniref:coatomer subunit beta n=1 Tax=Trichinella spiralis TaxID=6334 RepID=UPI0001EFC0FA|nr:coatomer subunit beta [Trichinella spiralis]
MGNASRLATASSDRRIQRRAHTDEGDFAKRLFTHRDSARNEAGDAEVAQMLFSTLRAKYMPNNWPKAGQCHTLPTVTPKEWLNSGDLFQRAEAMVVFDIVAPDHLKPNLQSLKTYRLNEDSTPEFSTLWLEIQKTFSENDPTLIESSMNGVNSGNDIPIASTYDDTPALFAQGSSDELPLDKETKATLAIKSWLEENKTVRNGVPDLYLFNFESLLWIVEQQHTATNSQEVRDAIAKIETLITKELQNSYTHYSFYSQDYAVTFNIIFWLMFSFIITIMFIGVGMWTMSPGRDSLIYQ